jgi:transcriptional antiterminator Rof (Rho-off)
VNVVSFSRKAGKVSKNEAKDPTSMIKTLYMLIKSVQAVELLKLDSIMISSIERSLVQLMHMLTELSNLDLI